MHFELGCIFETFNSFTNLTVTLSLNFDLYTANLEQNANTITNNTAQKLNFYFDLTWPYKIYSFFCNVKHKNISKS